MQIHRQKSLFIPLMSGVIIASSGLVAAPFIAWVPAPTPVPMSMGSLILLAVMFMAGGSFLLFKSQNQVTRSVLSVILLAGTFGFVQEAKASIGHNVSIEVPQGQKDLDENVRNYIHNSQDNIAVSITISTGGCPAIETDCEDILQPGDSCEINLFCDI